MAENISRRCSYLSLDFFVAGLRTTSTTCILRIWTGGIVTLLAHSSQTHRGSRFWLSKPLEDMAAPLTPTWASGLLRSCMMSAQSRSVSTPHIRGHHSHWFLAWGDEEYPRKGIKPQQSTSALSGSLHGYAACSLSHRLFIGPPFPSSGLLEELLTGSRAHFLSGSLIYPCASSVS